MRSTTGLAEPLVSARWVPAVIALGYTAAIGLPMAVLLWAVFWPTE